MTIQIKAIFLCDTIRYSVEGGFSNLVLWMKSPECDHSIETIEQYLLFILYCFYYDVQDGFTFLSLWIKPQCERSESY